MNTFQTITNKLTALILLVIVSPLFVILYIVIKFMSTGPFLFQQKRMGRNKEIFTIYKIRTMYENAEKEKEKLIKLNEADGPVFKMRNDPRYTKIGKVIARLGLDELPQLINIIKREMAFVGPRPLPTEEANLIPEKYRKRFSVLPGITSLWVVKGGHGLSFQEWMKLDMYYVVHRSFRVDIKIIFKTVGLFFKAIYNLRII